MGEMSPKGILCWSFVRGGREFGYCVSSQSVCLAGFLDVPCVEGGAVYGRAIRALAVLGHRAVRGLL